jgi:hypothetical protein
MSETAETQKLNASVRVENEDAIQLSAELTDQIRAYALQELADAHEAIDALLAMGATDEFEVVKQLADLARAMSKNAEVVTALTWANTEED